jgi:hypothetical protein
MAERRPPNGVSQKRQILFSDFKGCDTHAARTAIDKQKFSFLENLQPVGYGNLKTVQAPVLLVLVP